jgi:hypothetical protein
VDASTGAAVKISKYTNIKEIHILTTMSLPVFKSNSVERGARAMPERKIFQEGSESRRTTLSSRNRPTARAQ